MAFASFPSRAEAEAWLAAEGFAPVPEESLPRRSWRGGRCAYFIHHASRAGAMAWPVGGGWRAGTWLPSDRDSRVLARAALAVPRTV